MGGLSLLAWLLLVLFLCTVAKAKVPQSFVLEDRCDRVELAHFYSEDALPSWWFVILPGPQPPRPPEQYPHLIHSQLIFYNWCEYEKRFQVSEWRLQKTPQQIPTYDPKTREYVATWFDGMYIRRIRAKSFEETWKQYDREIVERQFLHKEKRTPFMVVPRQHIAPPYP